MMNEQECGNAYSFSKSVNHSFLVVVRFLLEQIIY